MIYGKLLTIRFFFGCFRNAEPGVLEELAQNGRGRALCDLPRRSVLAILGAALLASLASGQVPSVAALPLLVDSSLGTPVILVAPAVAPIPPAVQQSGFAGLLGGGVSTLLVAPEEAVATTITIAAIHQALVLRSQAKAETWVKDAEIDTLNFQAQETQQSNPCTTGFVRTNKVRARLMAKTGLPHLKAMDTVCSLPEEEAAEESEEALQELQESGEATQDVIEAAEVASEAAEVAAEVAEEAIEITLEALEIADTVLEAISLF